MSAGNEFDEVIDEFLVESHENLDRLDRELVELEQDPSSKEILAGIFRSVHTIKGTSGFFGFDNLQSLTHAGETLLAKLREGSLLLTPEMTSALLRMLDAVRLTLAEVERTRTDAGMEFPEIAESLRRLYEPDAPPAPPPAQASEPAQAAAPGPAEADGPIESAAADPAATPEPTPVDGAGPLADAVAAALSGETVTPEAVLEAFITTVSANSAPGAAVAAEAAAAVDSAADSQPEAAVPAPPAPAGDGPEADATDATDPASLAGRAAGTSVAESSVRVDVRLLDTLMNLVGELVLARNQILQYSSADHEVGFAATTQQLNLITTELQAGVMKTRLQPIDTIWSKFPRVVRDLAIECGKEVRIQMDGKETELDRTIIEAIKDPLTHLIRNSVDHGIERPEDRLALGKAAEGTLRLRAFHEGGQVNIEINDDGRGIDVDLIIAKAVERGLVPADKAARMAEREIANLIFLPGFSTAQAVTNVSGRGVGMDVVKNNIERIGGTLDLQSQRGAGTTVRIKIPLTLAIIPALIVSGADARYAIPQVSLVELLRLDDGHGSGNGIEHIGDTPVYRLRGELLPIVHLSEVLEMGERPASGSALTVAVLQSGDRRFGLVVDGIRDTEEIVVKPLGRHLKALEVFAGTTIMGDGTVALILDVARIAQRAGVTTEDHELAPQADESDERRTETQSLLVCSVADQRFAVPVSLISRLEEFEDDEIERVSGHEVIQYRGRLLTLVRLAQHLGLPDSTAAATGDGERTGPMQVLVLSDERRTVGLVVDRIEDIVEHEVDADSGGPDGGPIGGIVVDDPASPFAGLTTAAVIGRRATDHIDVEALLVGLGLAAAVG